MAEREEHKQIKQDLAEHFQTIGATEIQFEVGRKLGNKNIVPDISVKSPCGEKWCIEIGTFNCQPSELSQRLWKTKELGYRWWVWIPKKEGKQIKEFFLYFAMIYDKLVEGVKIGEHSGYAIDTWGFFYVYPELAQ